MNRVLVVDDHSLVRAGISLLLEHQDDMEPVGQAGTAAEAVQLTAEPGSGHRAARRHVPGGSGLECLPELLTASPGVKVLMLSMHEDASYVRAALSAGAAGYVLKDAAYEELVDAIRKVAAGQSYVAPALGAKLAVQSESTAEDELSEREREVLSLLARGYTNQEIAAQAVRQRPHRRVPPCAHPDETPALDPGGSRELRARVGPTAAGAGRLARYRKHRTWCQRHQALRDAADHGTPERRAASANAAHHDVGVPGPRHLGDRRGRLAVTLDDRQPRGNPSPAQFAYLIPDGGQAGARICNVDNDHARPVLPCERCG